MDAEAGEATEFADARERKYTRQDTGGTAYFTPRASPLVSAAAELPAQHAGSAASGTASPPGAVQRQQAEEAGAGAGMEAGRAGSVHEGSSGYSASVEESHGSEEDVEVRAGRHACGCSNSLACWLDADRQVHSVARLHWPALRCLPLMDFQRATLPAPPAVLPTCKPARRR